MDKRFPKNIICILGIKKKYNDNIQWFNLKLIVTKVIKHDDFSS